MHCRFMPLQTAADSVSNAPKANGCDVPPVSGSAQKHHAPSQLLPCAPALACKHSASAQPASAPSPSPLPPPAKNNTHPTHRPAASSPFISSTASWYSRSASNSLRWGRPGGGGGQTQRDSTEQSVSQTSSPQYDSIRPHTLYSGCLGIPSSWHTAACLHSCRPSCCTRHTATVHTSRLHRSRPPSPA